MGYFSYEEVNLINFSLHDNFINLKSIVKRFFAIGKNIAVFMTFVMGEKVNDDKKTRLFRRVFAFFSSISKQVIAIFLTEKQAGDYLELTPHSTSRRTFPMARPLSTRSWASAISASGRQAAML